MANFLDDTVSIFDTENLDRISVLETEACPHGLYMSPNGRWIIATGFSSDYLRVYDAPKQMEGARIEVGRGSSHVAILADEETAYVACSVDSHLARLDLVTMTCSQRTGIS